MLHSRLLNILQRELDSQNLQLPAYCTQHLETLVANGVQRMRTSNSLENAAHVLQAERNLRSLIKYLSDYSNKTGTYPTLTMSHFDAAMSRCPTFWPYCSSG